MQDMVLDSYHLPGRDGHHSASFSRDNRQSGQPWWGHWRDIRTGLLPPRRVQSYGGD